MAPSTFCLRNNYPFQEGSFVETTQTLAEDLVCEINAAANADNSVVLIAESTEQIGNRVIELELLSILSSHFANLHVAFQKPSGYPYGMSRDILMASLQRGTPFSKAVYDAIPQTSDNRQLKYESCLIPAGAWAHNLPYASIDVARRGAYTASPLQDGMLEKLKKDPYFLHFGRQNPDFFRNGISFYRRGAEGALFRNLFMAQNILDICGPVIAIVGARQMVDPHVPDNPGLLEMLIAAKKDVFSLALHTPGCAQETAQWQKAFDRAQKRLASNELRHYHRAHSSLCVNNNTGVSTKSINNKQTAEFYTYLAGKNAAHP